MKGSKPKAILEAASPVLDVPRAPTWLSPEAKAEWRRIMPLLVERRILTDADMGGVEAYCVTMGRVREIERLIRAAGGDIDPKLFRMSDKAMQTGGQLAAELGLTPVSRSRPANANPDLQPLVAKFNPLLERLAGIRATVAALKSEISGISSPAPAKAPDLSAYGTLDAQKEKDQFGAQILKNRVDAANNDDATRARKKTAEILKDADGLGLSPGAAYKTALQEIKIEDTPSGHKAHKPKKPKKTDEEKDAEKHDKEVKDEVKSLEEESRKQDAATASQGKSNAEKRTAVELAKLKVDASSKEGQSITTLITKIEAEKDSLAKLEKQRDQLAETANYFRDGFANALDEIIVKGGRASDVFKSLLQSLESAALKSLLTGEGPLGGIFGSTTGAATATNLAGGGILGALLKGALHFADGGQISGPGGPRSDNLIAAVSPGEFVVNAKSAQANLPLLAAINSGKLPAFADGGQVGGGSLPSISGGSGSSGAPSIMVQHNLTMNANGSPEENQTLAKQMQDHVEQATRRIVSSELQRQMRPGNLLDGTKFSR